MKVTIIYDDETWKPGLEASWGFSCLVEMDGRRLLFDTGGDGATLLKNMETLNLDPRSIPEIFISHEHWDHFGGLAKLLRLNREVRVYLPWSCPRPPEAREVIKVREPLKIFENFFSTGELPGAEQSLVVKTGAGLAVICGCSHPGVGRPLPGSGASRPLSAACTGSRNMRFWQIWSWSALVIVPSTRRKSWRVIRKRRYAAAPGGCWSLASTQVLKT